MRRHRLLPLCGLVLTLLPGPALPAAGAAAGTAHTTDAPARHDTQRAAPARRIAYTQWDTGAELRSGRRNGLEVHRQRLVLGTTTRQRRFDGGTYDVGRWVSPWVTPGFGLTELVGSWSARTPGDSWVEVRVRGRAGDGTRSSWDTLGRWTSGDRFTRRASVSGQADDLASVAVDTWRADPGTAGGGGLSAYRLEVRLMRRAGSDTPLDDGQTPSLDTVGAMASRLPTSSSAAGWATSAPGVVSRAGGAVLDVPRFSQMVHSGHYPRWGGGGEAWCSPTSTAMVLGYYGALPGRRSRSWVPAGHPDPWVDQAARSTYDAAYAGTGNWPFNTAWAATRTGHAFVTRLRSLREAERFVAAGIPLVASISFGRGELDGAPISATDGHLVVIVGFRADGDVVVNDPAAPRDRTVRRVYDRGQLERAWRSRSGGLVYVVRDDAHPLPGGTPTNW